MMSHETIAPGGSVALPGARARRGRTPTLLAGLAAAALMLLASGPAAQAQPGVPGFQRPASARLMPLVPIDEELDEYLHEAQAHIDAKQYTEAIDVLQSLIATGGKVFHQPNEKVRRYISVRAAAVEVLGRLPDEALALYRQQCDPKAAALYQEAQGPDGAAALRRIVTEYFHTSYGDRAADLLAALAFDEGRFLEAAGLWETVVTQHRGGTVDRTLALAKAATAYHLGGEAAKAAEILKTLKSKHANAEGVIAGRRRNLSEFVEQALAQAPPALVAALPMPAGWPCFGGSPTGLATMNVSEKATFPLWRQPATPEEGLDLGEAVLGFLPPQNTGMPAVPTALRRKQPQQMRVDVQDGLVTASFNTPDRRFAGTVPAPIMIRPILVGDLVIYRTDQEVIACDVATGETVWKSVRLPMLRETRVEPYLYQMVAMGILPTDTGRYGLTAGPDKVYAVARFPVIMPRNMVPPNQKPPSESSSIVALSLAERGKIVWEVGNGAGTSDAVRDGRFMTVPTYHDGKLYAVARRAQSYFAICLNADSGTTLWETPIGQAGGGPNPFEGFNPAALLQGEQGTPPAVGGGRVTLTTNAGLITCLSADTGQPLWNYQYDSMPRVNPYNRAQGEGPTVPYPPNPVILAEGRVICLPGDSEKIVCLMARTGDLAWEADRQKQHDLAAIDEDHLLLTGRSLRVLRVRDGGTLCEKRDLNDLWGRPAVGLNVAVACGKGRMIRLDLRTYAVEARPVPDDQVLLGGLVGAEGHLIASSAAGLCAFFGYDDAWKSLEARLAKAATPAERLGILLRRGRFALQAGDLDRAHGEFASAVATAESLSDAKAKTELRSWMHRLALRCAMNAKGDADLGRCLAEAQSFTYGPASEAEMTLRLVRYHEKYGRFAEAVRLAQSLAEKYAQVRLRDVALDSDDAPARPDDAPPPFDGYTLGHRQIERLIKEHGRQVYAEFDAAAQDALEKGKAAGNADALVAAQARYPRSGVSDRLLLAAGEILYLNAVTRTPPDEKGLARAARVLGELRNLPDNSVSLQGQAGEALVDARLCPRLWAVMNGEIWKADAARQVEFADFRGTVGELRDRLDALAAGAPAAGTPRFIEHLGAPLREVYRVKDTQIMVVRQPDGTPVRIGPKVLLRTSEKIQCLDTRANEFAEGSGLQWSVSFPWPVFAPFAACLTQGGRRIAIASPDQIVLLEAATGSEVYRRSLRDQDAGDWYSAATDGERMYFGRANRGVTCVDLAHGDVAWQAGERTNDGMPYVIHVAGDVVLAMSAGMPRRVACYDARNGRQLFRTVLNQGGEALLTPDGLMVLSDGARVSLHDPYRGDKPLWQVTLTGSPVGLLAASRTHVAVTDPQTYDQVRLLDLAGGGRTVGSVPLRNSKGNPHAPISAWFDRDRLYVLSGLSRHDMYYYGNVLNVQSPALEAIDWANSKALWTTSLPAPENMNSRVRNPLAAGEFLTTFVAAQDGRSGGATALVATGTGLLVPLPAAPEATGQDLNMVQQRTNFVSGAVILNGRALIEEATGLALLRSPL